MTTLNEFLKQLGEDAALLEAYKKDPEGVMRANGLSEDEIQAVMTGDKSKLRSLGGDEEYQTFVVVNHGNDA
ncbi:MULTISPECIES: hypothetical protein [Shewanella]|jgi:hypothetical protein|uniref:Extradiol ring-cleavage dioxygenase LigAB LigA subunit domain-containing protein n=2 Tax=Shewanella TaxID=22 RepID=A0AAJ1EYV1_9GAMM|nr:MULTISPECIES: hypothetical protein [Shewanella]AZQ11248.1 Aromatic-ring-opening dioxygenase LigAB, LigA subunit [Shewanella khirikhana]MCH4295444.1 hypothetical protein [Shewanella zhuhaiensis]